MDSIPRYIEGKHDPSKVKYLHPLLEPALKVTYGCMVYQEQVMQIVRDMAGYSMGRSDLVRRAMAKKKQDVYKRQTPIWCPPARCCSGPWGSGPTAMSTSCSTAKSGRAT